MRWEEKWRPDRTCAREWWLGGGRGFHPWGDHQGSEDQGGARLALPLPSWALGNLRGSQAGSSTLQGPLQATLVLGA